MGGTTSSAVALSAVCLGSTKAHVGSSAASIQDHHGSHKSQQLFRGLHRDFFADGFEQEPFSSAGRQRSYRSAEDKERELLRSEKEHNRNLEVRLAELQMMELEEEERAKNENEHDDRVRQHGLHEAAGTVRKKQLSEIDSEIEDDHLDTQNLVREQQKRKDGRTSRSRTSHVRHPEAVAPQRALPAAVAARAEATAPLETTSPAATVAAPAVVQDALSFVGGYAEEDAGDEVSGGSGTDSTLALAEVSEEDMGMDAPGRQLQSGEAGSMSGGPWANHAAMAARHFWQSHGSRPLDMIEQERDQFSGGAPVGPPGPPGPPGDPGPPAAPWKNTKGFVKVMYVPAVGVINMIVLGAATMALKSRATKQIEVEKAQLVLDADSEDEGDEGDEGNGQEAFAQDEAPVAQPMPMPPTN